MRRCAAKPANSPRKRTETVSYTHLDVYKRQAQDRLNVEQSGRKEISARLGELSGALQRLGEQASGLSEQIGAMQSERQQRDSRLKLLREMQRDYEGYNNSVKQVLMQARRLSGSGVHVVVADLIHVPE